MKKPLWSYLNGLWLRLCDYNWDFFAFRIVAWLVVVAALAALWTKATIGRPSGTPLHFLLGLALLGALLPAVLSGLLPLVRKIKLKEFEVELVAEADAAIRQLFVPDPWPLLVSDTPGQGKGYPADRPYPVMKLQKFQQYYYERFSQKLYQLFESIKSPKELTPQVRDKYRSLIKNVGLAAIAMEHATKAADIVSQLKLFGLDQLDANELHLLGRSHLWAATEASSEVERQAHWKEAVPLLEAASKLNAHEPRIFFNLGFTLICLRSYETGIEMTRAAIKLDHYVTPWGKWNIGCAQVALAQFQNAITTLEEIEEGPWWSFISEDPDLTALKDHPSYAERFRFLCADRKTEKAVLVRR